MSFAVVVYSIRQNGIWSGGRYMEQKLSREELVELVKAIMSVRDKQGNMLSEDEHLALLVKFKKNIAHPGGTDLIYYPTLVGLSPKPTVDEIVDLAIKGT